MMLFHVLLCTLFLKFPFYLEPLCCIPVAFIAICFVLHPFWIPAVFNHAVSSGSLFATLLLSGAKHSSLFVCVVKFLIRFRVCDFYFDFKLDRVILCFWTISLFLCFGFGFLGGGFAFHL